MNNPDGSTTSFNLNSDLVTFKVDISDPCTSAVLNAISFSVSPMAVTDGDSVFTEWSAPTTDIDDDSGLYQACGPVIFQVYADDSDTALSSTYNAAWAEITEPSDGTYRLTANTLLDFDLIGAQSSISYTLYIKQHLKDYTSQFRRDEIVVDITATVCDC